MAKGACEQGWYSTAAGQAQQCVEKAIKAVLEMQELTILGHEISLSFRDEVVEKPEYADWHSRLNGLLPDIYWFDGVWTESRYPRWDRSQGRAVAPMERFDKERADEAIEKAERVLTTLQEFLEERFKLSIEVP